MIALLGILALAIHVALLLAAAPLVVGTSDRLRARLLGRTGPHPLQPYRELARLLRKQPVRAEGASWLSDAAPVAAFAATAAAAALVPSFTLGMASAPAADLVVVAGLLAAARAIGLLAAMDCGASTSGGAAGRAATVATLADPALLLAILVLALLAGSTGIDAVAAAVRDSLPGRATPIAFTALAVAVVALALARQRGQGEPLDAEYSGRILALATWTADVRRLTLATLVATLFAPVGLADAAAPSLWIVGILLWAAKVAVVAGVAALAETLLIPPRRVAAHRMLGGALLLALLASMLLLAGQTAT